MLSNPYQLENIEDIKMFWFNAKRIRQLISSKSTILKKIKNQPFTMALTDIVEPVQLFMMRNKLPVLEVHIYIKDFKEGLNHEFDILTGHKALEEYAKRENLKFDVEKWVDGYSIPCVVTELDNYKIRLFAYGVKQRKKR